jgi:vacuolar-type H+-ATPase subunit F/Vma7
MTIITLSILSPRKADESTTIIAVFANFILIIFIHSHFYNAFLKNIKQLKDTGEEQAALNIKFEKRYRKSRKIIAGAIGVFIHHVA